MVAPPCNAAAVPSIMPGTSTILCRPVPPGPIYLRTTSLCSVPVNAQTPHRFNSLSLSLSLVSCYRLILAVILPIVVSPLFFTLLSLFPIFSLPYTSTYTKREREGDSRYFIVAPWLFLSYSSAFTIFPPLSRSASLLHPAVRPSAPTRAPPRPLPRRSFRPFLVSTRVLQHARPSLDDSEAHETRGNVVVGGEFAYRWLRDVIVTLVVVVVINRLSPLCATVRWSRGARMLFVSFRSPVPFLLLLLLLLFLLLILVLLFPFPHLLSFSRFPACPPFRVARPRFHPLSLPFVFSRAARRRALVSVLASTTSR